MLVYQTLSNLPYLYDPVSYHQEAIISSFGTNCPLFSSSKIQSPYQGSGGVGHTGEGDRRASQWHEGGIQGKEASPMEKEEWRTKPSRSSLELAKHSTH